MGTEFFQNLSGNSNPSAGEPEAVRFTVVGGRPPAPGADPRDIPRGMEVLIKKSAVDPDFRELFLKQRSKAASTIDLELEASEAMMLDTVPSGQLEAIIAGTRVPEEHRMTFLGKAATAMLLALSVISLGCGGASNGIRPDKDRPNAVQEADQEDADDLEKANTQTVDPQVNDTPVMTKGIRPDIPKSEEKKKE